MSTIQYNSKGLFHGTCQFKIYSMLYDNGVPISATLDDGTVVKPDKNTIITNYKILFRNDAGQTHREDGPALIYPNGYKAWWINGQRHREDGPAIIYADGHKAWWINGQRHKIDGPAFIGTNGSKAWWINGKKHREDGPAIIGTNGDKAWRINDQYYGKGEEPPEEYLQALVSKGVIKHPNAFKRGSDDYE